MNPQELVARGFSPEWAVFLTSMIPVVELRGALPLAINLFKIHWTKAFLIAFFGNILPVPFILLLLKPATDLLCRIPLFKKFFDWLFNRTRKKSKVIEKYEEIGLLIFVAIPLPGTGAWTGALLAYLMNLDFKKSVLYITLGVFIAGVIVTSLCIIGWLGAIIAGCGVTIFILIRIFK
ncbi:MAG: small multi-drug export protein [candidate division WOR-3 bacterium]|nr:small multi-drug export protein [candidate division WOR-3 bacterium]